jgi:cytochrome b involved in lipid metabolism
MFDSEKAVYDHYKKTDAPVVLYKGKVYNVGQYVPLHPGGADYISDLYGKNIETAFEDQGHSKSAKKLFEDFPVIGVLKGYEIEIGMQTSGIDGQKPNDKLGLNYTEGGLVNQLWAMKSPTLL